MSETPNNKMIKREKWNKTHVQLMVMASVSVVFLFVFAYIPMMGVMLAFKDADKAINIFKSLFLSQWTLDNFATLFSDDTFWRVFENTLYINVLLLIFTFPTPIIFALLMNEVKSLRIKKGIQTVVNFPHLISWVIFGGIILTITDPKMNVIHPILEFLRISTKENPINLNLAQYFYPKLIIATIIKSTGWGSIIYMAAIYGIDPSLYEAAVIDGAGRWSRMWRITLPLIKPTIIIFLLLNISNLLNNSFEQFYVFQTTQNLDTTRVLATYIYTQGFRYRNYSTATALSLFEGIISVILLLSGNFFSKKITGEGIF